MSRSKWKNLLKISIDDKVVLSQDKDKKKINEKEIVVARNSIIAPEDVGKKIKIYNGKNFSKTLIINVNHIGHQCGEFAVTKIPAVYKRQSKKK